MASRSSSKVRTNQKSLSSPCCRKSFAVTCSHFVTSGQLVMLLMMIMLSGYCYGQANQTERCQMKDVAILMDTSGSIVTGQQISPFRSMRRFAKNLIGRLESGWDSQAVVHFSEKAEVVFNFTTFSTKEEMYQAIDDILQFNGNTDTAMGLRTLRQVTFAKGNGERDWVPNIAIVITDGRSNVEISQTYPEAQLLKNMNVTIYTIGVTNDISPDELKAIVSSPDYFIPAVDFNTLGQLSFLDSVVKASCRSNTAPPDCSSPVDITFILDQSSSIVASGDQDFWYRDLLGFVSSVIKNFNVSPNGTRVAVVKFSNNANVPILLDTYTSISTLLPAIRNEMIEGGQTNIASGLRAARIDVYNPGRGYRPNVVNVAFLITDGESNIEMDQTIPEANNLKNLGIELFVMGVGTGVNINELQRIASQPLDGHLYNAAQYPSLDSVWRKVARNICNAKGEPKVTTATTTATTTTAFLPCFVTNCIQCRPGTNNYCSTCSPGYLNINGLCVVQCAVPNCQFCSNPNVCMSCYTGFSLNTTTNPPFCQETPIPCNVPNCVQCSGPNRCNLCINGYNLDSSGLCVPQCSVPNCQQCSTPNRCSQCNSGYLLDTNGNCILPPITCNVPNCISCQTPNYCSQCENGYFLNNGRCTSQCNVPNCQQCSTPNRCSQCSSGYNLNSSGDCIPQCNVPNCQQCSTPNQCTSCNPGYIFNNNRECVLPPVTCNVANCISCQTTNYCSQCQNGFSLSNGMCLPQCNVPNCQQCSTPNRCSQCSSGYNLNGNGDCIPQCNVQFCQVCLGPNQCNTCMNGYVLNSLNICVLSCFIPHCTFCRIPNFCAQCDEGYYINNNGTCVLLPIECNVPNCQQCPTSNRCAQCNSGYSLDNSGNCILQCRVPNCQQCSTPNRCFLCFSGYTLDNNGNCIPQCNVPNCQQCLTPNQCNLCNSNYNLNAPNSCVPQCNVPNCQRCSEPNRCSQCFGNFVLENGSCREAQIPCNVVNCMTCIQANLCYQCLDGYILENNICRIRCEVLNCYLCNRPSVCAVCNSGYNLNTLNNRCDVQCNVLNCAVCSSPNVCAACNGGYNLNLANNRCDLQCQVTNCYVCNSANVCGQCSPGYNLNVASNRCDPQCNVANCAYCSAPNVCSGCNPGYNLNAASNRCDPQCNVQYCSQCLTPNQCYLCNSGYFVDNSGQCSPTCRLDYCLICLSSSVCARCYDSYFWNTALSPPTCAFCPIPNCDRCLTTTTCDSCRSGYDWSTLVQPPACIPRCGIANCQICQTQNTCQVCNAGFFLDNTQLPSRCLQCSLPNCMECSSLNQCRICNLGYFWYPPYQACTNCPISNCLQCDSLTNCAKCQPRYFWNGNQCIYCPIPNCDLCQSTTTCATCGNGYFWDTSANPPTCSVLCPNQVDIMFVIDNSGMLDRQKYTDILNFLSNLVLSLPLSNNQIRISVMTYSDYPVLNIPFTVNQNLTMIAAQIRNLSYSGQYADLGAALKQLYNTTILNSLRSAPVLAVAVVVSNGVTTDRNATLSQAMLIKNQSRFAVSILTVGNFKDDYVLSQIASYPYWLSTFQVPSTSSLTTIQKSLTEFTCNSKNECQPNNPCRNGGSCVDRINYYECFCLPNWGGKNCDAAKCTSSGDIVFVLDGSGSIDNSNFLLVVQFVQDVISQLDVATSPNDNNGFQVGLIVFSTQPRVIFHLNSYYSKLRMMEAVNVPFTSGDTNTADAIFLARTQLFNQFNGDRPNSPNILILLTDGLSSNSTATWQESSSARTSNINIITVGVGQDIDMNELVAVATSRAPSSPQSNVFVASNYSTLSTQLTNNLSSAICSDFRHCNASSCKFRGQCIEEFGGFSCRCTTGYTGIYCERECSGQLDLMIVVDLSGSIRSERFKYIQQLLIGIIRNLDLGQFMTRVGIIVFSDDAQLSIRLNDYWNMQDLITAIYKIAYRGQRTNTAAALNLLRTQAFTATNGDRSDVPNVAIIVSDGNSNINPSSTVDEAIACRQAGIRLVTASLGDSINTVEIKNIASFPIEFNAYNVTNYTRVDDLIQLAVQSTCDSNNECQSNTCQNGGTCVPLFNLYQCKCPRFYAGVNCERNCTVRSDVTIVLDFSGSIGYMEDWYNLLVSFTREVINGLDVDNDVARVAVVAYATDVVKTIYFNEYANKRTQLLEALAFYYTGGTTNTQAALNFVASSVFDANRGYRGFNSDVLKSVILLSDGESNVQAENTVPAANNLKRLGARVYSVVVGTDFNVAEMERISSNATMYTYRMPRMTDVKRVASQFLNDNCRI